MKRDESLKEIHEVLAAKGFRRDRRDPFSQAWRGVLAAAGRKIAVSIRIPDLGFVQLPIVCVEKSEELPARIYPHLMLPSRSLCYLDRNQIILDRYRPGGSILLCLQEAQKVLHLALTGAIDEDFAREFRAYWGLSFFYTDLPPGFSGTAKVALLKIRHDEEIPVVYEKGKLAATLQQLHSSIAQKALVESDCAVVRVHSNLTITTPEKWPPRNWRDVETWLANLGNTTLERVRTTIASGKGTLKWLILNATNGTFAIVLEVPPAYQKQEFEQPPRLSKLMKRSGDQFTISCFSAERLDATYLYGRNLEGVMANLNDLRIVQIGCGTVGGFLAHLLGQSGAGSGPRGSLTLIDEGYIQPENVGRHLLGIPYLNINKAEGCRDFIVGQLPHITIKAFNNNVLNVLPRLLEADLVIDATGEEAVSIALNDYILEHRPKTPPTLYLWLLGNGAAAQGLLNIDAKDACFKCLKPVLEDESRTKMMKVGEKTKTIDVHGCAGATYIPFPVSASVQCAALGLEMVLDWANGKPKPLQRNRQLDAERAHSRKDGNPARSAKCPACGVP